MRSSLFALLPTVTWVFAGSCATGESKSRDSVPSSNNDIPIACSLTTEDLKARAGELLPGLMRTATEVVDLENGLRLTFPSRPELLTHILAVSEQERACCRFLRFQLTTEPTGGPITLEVTGPAGTRELLRSL